MDIFIMIKLTGKLQWSISNKIMNLTIVIAANEQISDKICKENYRDWDLGSLFYMICKKGCYSLSKISCVFTHIVTASYARGN